MSPTDPPGRRLALGALAALMVGAGSGCAWITQNHAASGAYANQVTVAAQRAAHIEAVVAEAEVRIEQLEETIRHYGQTEADRIENIDQVNLEINRLRGRIEELRFEIDEMQRYLEEDAIERERRLLHAEQRMAQVERYLRLTPPPAPTDEDLGLARSGEEPVDEDVVPPPDEMPDNALGKLELAVEHMKDGRSGVARVILQQAIEQHAGARELPEIRYRLAETHFNDESWGPAARAFQSVIDHHPQSEWASWAMLRIGECFQHIGRPDGARTYFESVIDNYPRTEAAREARKRLADEG